jgi:hypothetical protein
MVETGIYKKYKNKSRNTINFTTMVIDEVDKINSPDQVSRLN